MGLISKSLTLACALGGAAAVSQLPEFSQQYRQRLGGAIQELKTVVSDFDKDAEKSGLDRDGALSQLLSSAEQLPRDRGASMKKTIIRYTNLSAQQAAMEISQPVARPLVLLQGPDRKMLEDTWKIYKPAVPLDFPGVAWGGLGALFAGLIGWIPIALLGRAFRRKPKLDNINVDPPVEESMEALEPNNADAPVLQNTIPHKPQAPSLLNQVLLDEKFVGEVDAKGQLIPPDRKS